MTPPPDNKSHRRLWLASGAALACALFSAICVHGETAPALHSGNSKTASASKPSEKNYSRSSVAYDIDEARLICDTIPLESPEGIWIYPDDHVTVLVLKARTISGSSLPVYNIRVVESDDCSLAPGDMIGTISASPKQSEFSISLFTERKNGILSKPGECLASISSDGETMIIKRKKSPFKLRLSLNLSRLLPGFWKIVRIGASSQSSPNSDPPVGMVKIYPSYDGNGSSKRKPRYL